MIRHPRRSPLFPYTPLSRSRQPAERGELDLLRLLARARHVLDEHYAELLVGARVEQPQADVAPEQGEVGGPARRPRSEEHTSELQSLAYLVCRLLLEKKKHN